MEKARLNEAGGVIINGNGIQMKLLLNFIDGFFNPITFTMKTDEQYVIFLNDKTMPYGSAQELVDYINSNQ